MIQIEKEILKEIDKRKLHKTIFKGLRGFTVFWGIVPLSIIFLFLFLYLLGEDYMPLFPITIILFTFLYLYGFVNIYAKKQLEKIGVKPNKSWFKHWANDNYMSYKYELFRERLVKLKIITQNDFQRNSQLLKEYAEHFQEESDRITNFNILKTAGSIIVTFLTFFYQQFLKSSLELFLELFSKNNDSKNNEIFIIFLMSLLLIITVSFLGYLFDDISKSKKRKFNQISKELLNLKWNEDLKIKSTNRKPFSSSRK